MKAVLCKAYGPPESLVIEDVPSPTARPGEIVVAVKAASVNFPDVLIIQNNYQVKPPLPFSPGGEAAGVVKEVGEGVADFKPGDRVMVLTSYGAFAEELSVPSTSVMPIPDGMDDAAAAAFQYAYGTADHALRDRGALKAGETLLVLGAAGGVGLAAVEVGKAIGARVIACASTEDKLAVCRAHGADATINYARDDLREQIKHIAGEPGVNVVFDPVGGAYSELALRSMAWRGRFLVIGFAAGEIPRIPLNLALLKGCSIVGAFWGAFIRREPARFTESVNQLRQWYRDGRIKPHIDRVFPLERAAEALALLTARKVTGKLVLTSG